MKCRGPLILGALVLLSSITSVAHADVVELKTGQRVEGTLKQATPASVSVEVGGQTITFEGEKVRAIYFGAAPSTSAAPSSLVPSREAIKALRGLQSVTSSGVTYREYGPRLQDTKIAVDQYLQSDTDQVARPPIQSSMNYYVLASRAWALHLQRGPSELQLAALGRESAITECPALNNLIKILVPGLTMYKTEEAKIGFAAASPPALRLFWSCAADKIAEAEKLLGK